MSDDDKDYDNTYEVQYDSEEEWTRIKNRDIFDSGTSEDPSGEGSEDQHPRNLKRPRSSDSDEEHAKKKPKIEKETPQSQTIIDIDKLLDERMEDIEPDLDVDLTASTQKIPDDIEPEEEIIEERTIKVKKLPRTHSYYSEDQLFDSELSWYAGKDDGRPKKQYNPKKWDKSSGAWKAVSRTTKK